MMRWMRRLISKALRARWRSPGSVRVLAMAVTFVVVLIVVGVTLGDSTDVPIASAFVAALVVEAGIELWYSHRKHQ